MDIVTLMESQFCHFLWEEYIMELWIVSVPAPLAGRTVRAQPAGANGLPSSRTFTLRVP